MSSMHPAKSCSYNIQQFYQIRYTRRCVVIVRVQAARQTKELDDFIIEAHALAGNCISREEHQLPFAVLLESVPVMIRSLYADDRNDAGGVTISFVRVPETSIVYGWRV